MICRLFAKLNNNRDADPDARRGKKRKDTRRFSVAQLPTDLKAPRFCIWLIKIPLV